jgi:hypothetical protein
VKGTEEKFLRTSKEVFEEKKGRLIWPCKGNRPREDNVETASYKYEGWRLPINGGPRFFPPILKAIIIHLMISDGRA